MTGLTFNPYVSSNAPGSFNTSAAGLIQGQALDSPNARYNLSGGILDSTVTSVLFGGYGVSELIGGGTDKPDAVLGSRLTIATTVSAHTTGELTGFSVFDQNYAAVSSPQSPVPGIAAGGQVNFYRLGSGARIAVAMDPALVDLQGTLVTSQVSWDFVNQRLVPYLGTLTISSGTYNDTTGVVVLTMAVAPTFGAGDAIILSSLTGTGAYADLNGTWTVDSVSGSTVTFTADAGNGASAITGGSLTLGSGASHQLNVEVLDVQVGNSMVVEYDADTGFATWNRSGSCAVILL